MPTPNQYGTNQINAPHSAPQAGKNQHKYGSYQYGQQSVKTNSSNAKQQIPYGVLPSDFESDQFQYVPNLQQYRAQENQINLNTNRLNINRERHVKYDDRNLY